MYIYNKIRNDLFIFDIFENVRCFESILVLMVCFLVQTVIFNAFIGFCVFFCIYDHMLEMFLNICFKNVPEV